MPQGLDDLLVQGTDGRDEADDDGVDVGVTEGGVDRSLELARRGLGRDGDRTVHDLGPRSVALSAHSAASWLELPTMATRRPAGSGWWTSSCATSNIWWTFSQWMTPACCSIEPKTCGLTLGLRTLCPGGAP